MPADFSDAQLADIEATTQEVGRGIFENLHDQQPSIFERQWWNDRIMNWAMQDESVKVQMFRFVDVLPMLRSSEDVTRHLHEYFDEVSVHLPSAVRLGMSMASPGTLPGRAMAIAARRNASSQARRFIAGTTAEEVLAAAMRERRQRRCFTLDLLGEAVISDVEADKYLRHCVTLIRDTAPTANQWPEVPQIDLDSHGPLPRVNVSIKLSALDAHFDALDTEGTARRVGERLRQILRVAAEHKAFINFDMESYATKDLTLYIFKQVLTEEEFRHTRDVGIVIQCYLKDSGADLRDLRDWARQRGTPVWLRLVKGAYWDYETVHAKAERWPVPVYEHKSQTDENFERQTRFLFANSEWLRPAVASHNVRSLAHAIAVARHLDRPIDDWEIQMLYGMGDAEKQVLVDLGHRLRIYMPYGELIPGMAYLVRRLLENTSNDSFLRASFTEHVDPKELLMNPADIPEPAPGPSDDGYHVVGPAPEETKFRNEPHTDFTLAENRAVMRQALDELADKLGADYPLVIGGEDVAADEKLPSPNPSHKRQIVGNVSAATEEHVQQAVAAAKAALPEWSALGAEKRADLVRRAADEMRRRRYELAAWIVTETGKPWRESDADVAEAIDFCEYYAENAVALFAEHGVDVPGEENRFTYMPRGVAAVISPWNFPLAILTGMTTAALVTGNPVIMKPAEQSAVIGAKLMEVFRACEFPPGAVQYLPGRGEVAGAALVEHPDVALIAFTGSREVGLAINRRAAEVSASGAPFVKKAIAEMGGKNAVVVDQDADLDEAVAGVMKSAFGYQGQKCSACSRAIVLDAVYDTFLERLVEATRSLQVRPAEDPGCHVGPLIDEEALAKIHRYIELGRQEGREALAVDVGALAAEGYYAGPHIFADVPPDARLAREEIFGPVLSVIRAQDLDEAFRVVNATDYALTGGIFTRSPANLQRARREMLVGNLYLNRGITGALVSRQPFGGFKLSGIGSKAGGRDYLLQFVLPRTITENTMRRGFAPESSER